MEIQNGRNARQNRSIVTLIWNLSTSNGREFYKICVEDNGDGVPDEKKQTIFQRFERGTKKAHGKGLGLYIVKMLVEKYGGEIWVEDREKGEYSKGARFCFTIPKQVEGGSGK